MSAPPISTTSWRRRTSLVLALVLGDRAENAALHALRAWVEPKQIVNFWAPPAIRTWLGDKRGRMAALSTPRA